MVVALLLSSFSPTLVEVSFDNCSFVAVILEIFLVSTSQKLASLEILQAGWGADFVATRFGGTKVNSCYLLLSSIGHFWEMPSQNGFFTI